MSPFSDFCAAVCALVRYRPARAAIAAELTAHLADHAAALMEAGVPEEEAVRRAVDAAHPPALLLSLSLTKVVAVALGALTALFLVPWAGICAYNFFVPYALPADAVVVRQTVHGGTLRVERHSLQVLDVLQEADGALCVRYREFLPLEGYSMGQLQALDSQGRAYDSGGSARSVATVGKGMLTFHGFPLDSPTVTLVYDQYGRYASVTLPLEEVDAP